MPIQKGQHFIGAEEMHVESCYSCHVLFAMTISMYRHLRKSCESFYCPSGHGQHYAGKSKEEILSERLSDVQSCCDQYMEESATLRRSNIALKGHLARKKGTDAHDPS